MAISKVKMKKEMRVMRAALEVLRDTELDGFQARCVEIALDRSKWTGRLLEADRRNWKNAKRSW
jgi:hypothetical protein